MPINDCEKELNKAERQILIDRLTSELLSATEGEYCTLEELDNKLKIILGIS